MIHIGNIRNGDHGEYIGRQTRGRRGSPLANPYRMRSEADREKAVTSYRRWLEAMIRCQSPEVLGELHRLKKIIEIEGDVTLVCWCAPKSPCHAEVIATVLRSMVASEAA